MSFEIDLRIATLQCFKTNDPDTDEVYAEIKGKFANSASKIDWRAPQNNKIWNFAAGQSVGPNEIIYSGPVDDGLELEIAFKEEDGAGLVSMFDNTIGTVKVTLGADKNVNWASGKNTEYKGRQADGTHCFELNGAKAEYRVWLKLYEKILI